jgi:hypothetical protein
MMNILRTAKSPGEEYLFRRLHAAGSLDSCSILQVDFAMAY